MRPCPGFWYNCSIVQEKRLDLRGPCLEEDGHLGHLSSCGGAVGRLW